MADYRLTADPLAAFLITMLPACRPSHERQQPRGTKRNDNHCAWGWRTRRRIVDAGSPLCDSMVPFPRADRSARAQIQQMVSRTSYKLQPIET